MCAKRIKVQQTPPHGTTPLVAKVDALADYLGVTPKDLRSRTDWLDANGLEADDITDAVAQAAVSVHHYHMGRLADRAGVSIA